MSAMQTVWRYRVLTDTRKSKFAKVHSLDFDAVKWTGGLLYDTTKMCDESTVFQLKNMFDSKDISHVIENFKICAGEAEGDFDGTVFGDGDFYKWMESAIYSAKRTDNAELMKQIDNYIELIGKAQLEDGYLSTKQIIGERNGKVSRMSDVNDFEVYNFGHMFTAACLHKRITGKDSFLNIAIKTAGYLEKLYEDAAKTGEVQTAVCPSHYMGLIELYRTTNNKKYLDLAKLSIELRDSVKDGTDDNQDRIPLKKHEKIVGHAVRSNYLYAGVADLYAELGDESYMAMLDKVWKSLNDHKLYITGGCGALYNGVSPYGNFFIDQKIHQAYGYEYQLPNITAYNETCASIGLVMWAYRMFNVTGEAEYFDIIERAILNVNMAAISLDGKRYFYENMLRRAKKMEFEMVWKLERTEYILSYCCPPNLARLLSQTSEYAYTISEDSIWTGVYGENKASICLENGAEFTLEQKTGYPYDGKIDFMFTDIKTDKPVSLNIRIPGWVSSGYIKDANGNKLVITKDDANTYAEIYVERLNKTEIEVYFDMKPRFTVSNTMVEENTNQAALEKGPLVYCMESPDAEVETLDDILWNLNSEFKLTPFEIDNRAVGALEGSAYALNRNGYDRNSLYQTFEYKGMREIKIRLIPYFAWDNRGFGEMKIWFPMAFTAIQADNS